MVMTDPIADMLTRIRNANSVYHDKVEIPGSKIKEAMEQNMFGDYSAEENIDLFLKHIEEICK